MRKAGDIPSWFLAASQSLLRSVEMKDPSTAAHCVRVAHGSRMLAKVLGLNEYQQKVVEFAGLFHDIGKVGVPDQVLLKPGRLTNEEYEVMKSHPEKSAQMLEPLNALAFVQDVLPGVLHHHERYDGKGYPVGVMGEKIPLEARLILIVDTFDAMTMSRVYREPQSVQAAYDELKRCAGTQFDLKLVGDFLRYHPTWRREEEQVAAELHATVFKPAA